MYKPESILENEKNKVLWDLEIQTNHIRPDQVIINKKKRTYWIVNFAHKMKIKENKRAQYMDFVRELKKLWNFR